MILYGKGDQRSPFLPSIPLACHKTKYEVQKVSDTTTTSELENRILKSLHSSTSVTGLTHNFYRYPARMSPELVREIIRHFSQPGDVILDPFMGGATSIVEAVAAGRRAIGIDLNPLAHFVGSAKTTPLSQADQIIIRQWAQGLSITSDEDVTGFTIENEPRAKNLPPEMTALFAHLIEELNPLLLPRQRRFIQCVLLRLGQWAVDCKSTFPDARTVKEKLICYVDEMLDSLNDFVETCDNSGVAKNKITGQRELLLRSTVDAQADHRLQGVNKKPVLVITSPPYPSVHVLYHRWQVAGRRETPAPYWLIGSNDGYGASYYTFGSRDTALGSENYFRTLRDAYDSVRAIIHPEALVVQLVSFSDVSTQLPIFLEAMQLAGYYEDPPINTDRTNLWRSVPHRKWYNYIGTTRGASQELLLFHRPSY